MKTIKPSLVYLYNQKKKNEKSDLTGAGDLWIGVCAVCTGTINGRYYKQTCRSNGRRKKIITLSSALMTGTFTAMGQLHH